MRERQRLRNKRGWLWLWLWLDWFQSGEEPPATKKVLRHRHAGNEEGNHNAVKDCLLNKRTVLDELDTDALADSRVGLLGLNTARDAGRG